MYRLQLVGIGRHGATAATRAADALREHAHDIDLLVLGDGAGEARARRFRGRTCAIAAAPSAEARARLIEWLATSSARADLVVVSGTAPDEIYWARAVFEAAVHAGIPTALVCAMNRYAAAATEVLRLPAGLTCVSAVERDRLLDDVRAVARAWFRTGKFVRGPSQHRTEN